MRSRQNTIEDLRRQPDISVLIIGAGINGAALFRDLALNNVDVLIVDKADYSSGASAAASRMVHGGLRYMENAEFRLVREAVHERNRLLVNAPHYVTPLATTVPIFKWFSGLLNAPFKFLKLIERPSERGAVVIKLGLILYDAYTRRQSRQSGSKYVDPHTFRLRRSSLQLFPEMNPEIRCTATYFDAAVSMPERLAFEMILEGEQAHDRANALNYMRVVDALGERVSLLDEDSGDCIDVRPRLVINASGPWVDFANRSLGAQTAFINGTKGSHIVLDNPQLRKAIAGHEIFFENYDGRIVLIYPLMDKVLVGSTDIPINDPDQALCTDEEVDYFFKMVQKVFPKMPLSKEQIVYRFSGVRPLPPAHEATTSQISRDHSIRNVPPNGARSFPVYCLIGGKWTTFRSFAEQAGDLVLGELGCERKHNTQDLGIGGGKDYPRNPEQREQWLAALQKSTRLTYPRLKVLFDRYGTSAKAIAQYISAGADRPLRALPEYSRREISYLALYDGILHVDDLLLRRSMLGILGLLSAGLIDEVTEIIAEAQEWPAEKYTAEKQRVVNLLANRHGVQLTS